MENPLAMDMDENDEKKLYEIADEDGGFKNLKDPSYVINSTTTPTSCWAKVGPIATFILIVLVALVLILQAVTIHQVINNTQSCDSDNVGSTGALTGDRTEAPTTSSCSCNTTDNKDLLREIIVMLNTSLSLGEMQSTQIQNTTDILEENLDTTQDASSRLLGVIGSLANVEDNTINTDGTVNDILLKVEAVLRLQNQSQVTELKSCQDIRDAQPDSPSGYYHIHSQIVYCEMGELCGSEGGWTRLAYLDMGDSTVNCPDGLALLQANGVRACGRPYNNLGSCSSVKFPSNGIQYSQVCGRVVGYQYASTDGSDNVISNPVDHNDINSHYVDGISVTRGYPRQHVWTFINGLFDSAYSQFNCPCNTPPGAGQDIQSFVGDNYFCESGTSGPGWTTVLYTNDPLWDGEGCGSQEGNCCAASGLPWFSRTFNVTTDYLELRVCGDQPTWDEDTPVAFYEMYIK